MTKEIKINGNPVIQTTILPDEQTFNCKNCSDLIQKGKTYFYDKSGSFCSISCYKKFNYIEEKRQKHNIFIKPEFIKIIKRPSLIQVTNHKWIEFEHQGELLEFLIRYAFDENIITLKNQEQNNE